MRSLFTGKEKFPPSPDPVLTAACPSLPPSIVPFWLRSLGRLETQAACVRPHLSLFHFNS